MDPAVEQKATTARKLGNGFLSLIDFVVTLVGFSLFALGLLFALALGGLVVGALAALLTGSAHQGLVVGAVLTGWTCLVVGVAARGGRRRPGGTDPPGLRALAREGVSLIARVVGLAAICALAPAVAAGAMTGNFLTAVAVAIVAFPVVLVQGFVAVKVEI